MQSHHVGGELQELGRQICHSFPFAGRRRLRPAELLLQVFDLLREGGNMALQCPHLFGGVIGLSWLLQVSAKWAWVFASAIAGALALCLIAISKPRYSFVFDPLLLICAVAAATSPRATLSALSRGQRWTIAAVFAFLAWAWIAFGIFSITSRAVL